MAKAKSMEENFEALNEIIQQLESPDVSLEDSFKLYNDGMKLLKVCNDSIDKVEKKIIVLNTEANNL